MDSGAIFLNNGTVSILTTGGSNISTTFGGGAFENAGVFDNNGSFQFGTGVTFNNTGTVNVQSGNFWMEGGDGSPTGRHDGDLYRQFGAEMVFAGAFDLAAGSKLNGAGNVLIGYAPFSMAAGMTLDGTINLSGTTTIDDSATTVTFSAANSTFGGVNLNAGALSGAGDVT